MDEVQKELFLLDEKLEQRESHNLGIVELYNYPGQFVLELNVRNQKYNKKLIIEKTGRIYQSESFQTTPQEKVGSFSCFLGIQYILDQAFLIFVEKVYYVCTLDNHDIFEIAKEYDQLNYRIGQIQFIPFKTDVQNQKNSQQISNHIINLKRLICLGYYFSCSYDLTVSRQKLAQGVTFERTFCWNYNLIKQFLQQKVDKIWTVSLIQGFVSFFSSFVQGKKLDLYLIKRRSWQRGGTRFVHRGIDDSANVANFVESEQISLFQNYLISHLQIRGSVPLFWQQRGMKAELKISRTYELTVEAYKKYWENARQQYGHIVSINLLSSHKSEEKQVTENYETLIRRNENEIDYLRYEYFDFHTQCKNEKYEKVNPIILKMMPHLQNFNFHVEDIVSKKVLVTQKGVFRTNCLDCLDRTNVVQSKLALCALDIQLSRFFGLQLADNFGQDVLEHMSNQTECHPFMVNFRYMWGTGGDYISLHYTGTKSTHTDVTIKGARDLTGKFRQGANSITRFYQQHQDNEKQIAIDMFCGLHKSTQSSSTLEFMSRIQQEMDKRKSEYLELDTISVYVLTWNVHSYQTPQQIERMGELFDFHEEDNADVVVVGLQEYISSNVVGMLWGSSEATATSWISCINLTLNKFDDYTFLKQKDLAGILTLIFIKKQYKSRFSNISYDWVQQMSMATKRGAVGIKFSVDQSSFCFINANLGDDFKMKAKNFDEIHQLLFQQEANGKMKEEKVEALDYKFFFGTTNISINMMNIDLRESLHRYQQMIIKDSNSEEAKKIFEKVLKQDELNVLINQSDFAKKYKEQPITFLPNYRYEPGKNTYDQNTKAIWSDRILYWDDPSIDPRFYDRIELNQSSHKPICAYFQVSTRKVNAQKQQQIQQEIYDQINRELDQQENPDSNTQTSEPQ